MDERICFPYADDLDDQPDFINDIVRIYDKMQDDVSREIFVSRLMLSLTRDYKYMKNVILQTEGGKKLNSLLCHAEKPPYIYGAGIRGKRLVKLFSDFNWGGFIDISTEQESYQNIKIIDPEMFMNLYTKGTVIIVSNMKGSEKIVDNLVSMGVVADDIYVLNDFDQGPGTFILSRNVWNRLSMERKFLLMWDVMMAKIPSTIWSGQGMKMPGYTHLNRISETIRYVRIIWHNIPT